jgi:hypothetical protein
MHSLRPDDNLLAWIAELRARLDRGDLARLAPIDLGYGTYVLSAGYTIRIMLADLDGFENLTLTESVDPVYIARRANLLADFRVLRFLIG